MLTFKACLIILSVAYQISEANGNPFQIFQRHFLPGMNGDISPRQGRNSKLMNFGAEKDTDALPLTLELEEEVQDDIDADEKLEDVIEEIEEVVDDTNPSLAEYEDAVTEVLMNDILGQIAADQEDRGGKQTEDKIGLTISEPEYKVPEERGGIKPQANFGAPNSLPQQSQVYQFKQPAPVGYNFGGYPNQQQQQQPLAQQPLPQQPLGQQPFNGQQQANYFNNQFQQQQPQFQYNQQQQQFGQQPYPSRGYGNAEPRSTGLDNEFGLNMGDDAIADPDTNTYPRQPQLDQSAVDDRQISGTTDSNDDDNVTTEPSIEVVTNPPVAPEQNEDDVRCINKVMQVEETVYDERVKCQHTFTEKCHNTFITDYVPTQEKKCETSFKKNCHITYKPMMFEEQVKVCNEPLLKKCDDDIVGEEVCKTHYETVCETRYKEHEVEQDEPVCEMVIERRCDDVTVPLPEATRGFSRRRRQAVDLIDGDINGNDLTSDLGFIPSENDLAGIGEKCEEWPIQKCRLEKKIVKKTNPETSCEKKPREICAPSNCIFEKSEKVCRDEARNLVQNIPSEQCDLEPQENCKMETVLVPRLIQQPNCIKVPKEICVNAKINPRKVKKPVIKEWCYRPKDLQSPSSRLALSQFFRQ